jgi:hypothetical protein
MLNIASMNYSESDKGGDKRNRKNIELKNKRIRQHESIKTVSVIVCDLSSQYVCVSYFHLEMMWTYEQNPIVSEGVSMYYKSSLGNKKICCILRPSL